MCVLCSYNWQTRTNNIVAFVFKTSKLNPMKVLQIEMIVQVTDHLMGLTKFWVISLVKEELTTYMLRGQTTRTLRWWWTQWRFSIFKITCNEPQGKLTWVHILDTFWMNKEKFTRAGFEAATSRLKSTQLYYFNIVIIAQVFQSAFPWSKDAHTNRKWWNNCADKVKCSL